MTDFYENGIIGFDFDEIEFRVRNVKLLTWKDGKCYYPHSAALTPKCFIFGRWFWNSSWSCRSRIVLYISTGLFSWCRVYFFGWRFGRVSNWFRVWGRNA